MNPWDNEPDHKEWVSKHGYKCEVHRVGEARRGRGYLCGYVSVPNAHPIANPPCDLGEGLEVHGGITFSQAAKDGESWMFGFDCGHSGDATPWSDLSIERIADGTETYRTFEYVEAQCESLSAQLAEIEREFAGLQPFGVVQGWRRRLRDAVERVT